MKKTIFLILFTMMFSVTAFADYAIEDNKRVYTPKAYLYKNVISGFAGISDIFIDKNNNLYVCDDSANVVIKYNKNFEVMFKIEGQLNKPNGLFVDDTQDIFVADTENKRIAHFDKNGKFVEEFKDIKSELLPKDFIFTPEKIAVTHTGYLLAIKGQNIMQIDSNSNFRGYFGQPEIGFNFTDLMLRVFASKEQKRFVKKRVAPPYTNIFIGGDGYTYAVSRDNMNGEIKKLNSVGKNTYSQNPSTLKQTFSFISSFISVPTVTQFLGERKTDNGTATIPVFNDICVDKNSIITVLDSNSCKIYQYDSEGNNLCSFGGKGNQKGLFDSPNAIAINSDGIIFVSDRNKKSIQMFESTDFINSVHMAVFSYQNGKYDLSYKAWQEVLNKDENYSLAHKGLGLNLYKRKEYKESLNEFVIANDRQNYSRAFETYRYQIFQDNFILVVLFVVLGIFAFFALCLLIMKVGKRSLYLFTYREREPNKRRNLFLLSSGVLAHPIDTFENIRQNRGHNKLYVGGIIILIAVFVRLIYILTAHFPLSDVQPQNAMLILEILKIILPVTTWAIASYAISSIMNGESKFSECLTASAFSILPYIIFTFVLGLVSNVLSHGEWAFYSIAVVIIILICLVNMFLSVMTLNRYSVSKTIVVCVISLLTMLLIWAVVLLLVALMGQLFTFASGIIEEIKGISIGGIS